MNKSRNLTAVAVMAAALWAGSAFADSEKAEPVPSRQLSGVFAPDPEGVWRTITQTDSTSDCIGKPVTPMCAVDTRRACFARWDNKFCSASSPFTGFDYHFNEKPSPGYYENYRVVSVRSAEFTDIDAVPVASPLSKRKVGDLLISVIIQSCTGPGGSCVTNWVPIIYTVRKYNRRWLILHTYSPRY